MAEYLSPAGAIAPTGPWSVGAAVGSTLWVAGMRGIDPETDTMVPELDRRAAQSFANMLHVAASAGYGATDCVRLVVYVTDIATYRPLVNAAEEEVWGDGPYPPRTLIQVSALSQGDVVEVEGTFAR